MTNLLKAEKIGRSEAIANFILSNRTEFNWDKIFVFVLIKLMFI